MKPTIRARFLSILTVAAVAASAGAQSKTAGSAEKVLIQANDSLLQAMRTGDLAQLQSLLAADLVYTDAAGTTQSRTQLLAAISSGYRLQSGPAEAVTARVDGNVGLLSYQSSAGDAPISRVSAVYVMRGGRWQLASQSTTGGAPRPAVAVAITPPTAPITVGASAAPTNVGAAVVPNVRTGRTMTGRASGTFEVEVKPISAYNASADAQVGRMSIDKKFHGDLDGTSKGEMLTAGTYTKGSAGYVAIERVSGTLNGKRGSFTFQHTATMNRGAPSLSITIVPDSGTGDLVGITGTMNIIIEGAKHSYQFDYSLPGGS